jgi:hypothetical protein
MRTGLEALSDTELELIGDMLRRELLAIRKERRARALRLEQEKKDLQLKIDLGG